MTDTPQSPAPAQAEDAKEQLTRRRLLTSAEGFILGDVKVATIIAMLDARDARIAELERQVLSTMDSRVVSRDEHDAAVARLTAALADQRALAADAQRANAATIGELRDKLAKAEAALAEAKKVAPCTHQEVHGTGNTRDGITRQWCARCGAMLPVGKWVSDDPERPHAITRFVPDEAAAAERERTT